MAKTKNNKSSKKNIRLKFSWIRIVIFLIFATIIGSTYFVREPIEQFVAHTFNLSVKTTEFGNVVSAGDLEIHYIDVGQGDSIAIRFPDGQKMLIDAGAPSSKNKLLDYLDKQFFKNDSSYEFDYVLLTHSDADHCGSIVAVYEKYHIVTSYRPYEYSTVSTFEPADNPNGARPKDTAMYGKYIDAIYKENNIAGHPDVRYAYAGEKIVSKRTDVQYNFEFLTPKKKFYNDANDYSPITLLEYGGHTFLFTGDAQKEQFSELSNILKNSAYKERLSRITVYKAAHHGSALHNSNNLEILKQLNPEFVVIEVGADNKFNHPHQKFLDWLEQVNVSNIYRTDKNGNILIGVSSQMEAVSATSTPKTAQKLNIITDIEVANAPQVLYYSWEIIASTLLFVVFMLCFYDYGYKKRQLLKKAHYDKTRI